MASISSPSERSVRHVTVSGAPADPFASEVGTTTFSNEALAAGLFISRLGAPAPEEHVQPEPALRHHEQKH